MDLWKCGVVMSVLLWSVMWSVLYLYLWILYYMYVDTWPAVGVVDRRGQQNAKFVARVPAPCLELCACAGYSNVLLTLAKLNKDGSSKYCVIHQASRRSVSSHRALQLWLANSLWHTRDLLWGVRKQGWKAHCLPVSIDKRVPPSCCKLVLSAHLCLSSWCSNVFQSLILCNTRSSYP